MTEYQGMLRRVLREELDGLHSLHITHKIGRDLDSFFSTRTVDPLRRLRTSEVWTGEGVKLAKGEKYVEIVSRAKFSYPCLTFAGKFHTKEGFSQEIGLSAGTFQFAPTVCAVLRAGTNVWFTGVKGGAVIPATWFDFLPPDYDTVKHWYMIKVNKQFAELFVDGTLRAVLVFGAAEAFNTVDPPYALRVDEWPLMASEFHTYVEFSTDPEAPAAEDEFWPIDPFDGDSFTAESGDPMPPRCYRLYTTGTETKWNGLTTDVEVVSHPVPIWGYGKKSFLLQSNAAGTAVLEAYLGGGWREVARVTLTADELWDYQLLVEAPIARMRYIPAAVDTIAVGEVNLS